MELQSLERNGKEIRAIRGPEDLHDLPRTP